MRRRSRFIEPAKEWLSKHNGREPITLRDFWQGLSLNYPELTQPSEGRKTPRATCMRDLRYSSDFEVIKGTIRIKI